MGYSQMPAHEISHPAPGYTDSARLFVKATSAIVLIGAMTFAPITCAHLHSIGTSGWKIAATLYGFLQLALLGYICAKVATRQ